MAGLFSQVMGEDDMTREKCIEFVSNTIMKHKNELFAKNFETEQFFIEQIKQVWKWIPICWSLHTWLFY